MTLAIVVIASEKRRDVTLDRVLQSTPWMPHPDVEVVVVGDWDPMPMNPRYLKVAPITRTTIDALIKRDAGWAATTADTVMFLCDDHRLGDGNWHKFLDSYRHNYEHRKDWHFLAPSRFVMRDGEKVWLNVGRNQQYIGGHAGIYRRLCGNILPWTAAEHHPNWDLIHSHQLVAKGARLVYADTDLAVEDIEPGATPWL